jgi:hypothetical protein
MVSGTDERVHPGVLDGLLGRAVLRPVEGGLCVAWCAVCAGDAVDQAAGAAMSELSRHWVVDRPGDAGTYEQITITDERNVAACRDAGWRVQGPFVPEARLVEIRAEAEKISAAIRAGDMAAIDRLLELAMAERP